MKIYAHPMKAGITRTLEFERKTLATHAVNTGLICGHQCTYCSSPSLFRTLPVFRQIGESPFGTGYCVFDPATPDRVARDAQRLCERGMIQFCSFSDAWAPECQQHQLGRRCLQAILVEPGWTIRILTKNAAVRDEFDLIGQYRDRVLVGLSITGTPDREDVVKVLEPNASSITDRMLAMVEARTLGLRTYAMLCPLMPGISDSPEQVDRLVHFAVEVGAEEIFVEPVNPRGPGLKRCQELLEKAGYMTEAAAIERIRHQNAWSNYVATLIHNVQTSVRRHAYISKLRFLLYPSHLKPTDRNRILEDDAGVIWLGKKSPDGRE
jgi:DNA repair photolyase